jgi:Rieske Fe-S protein
MMPTDFNRRQFLVLATATVAGCKAAVAPGGGGLRPEKVVDAGPAGDYAADGVYNRFLDRGFFVVRSGDKLFVLSSFCTHRRCKLTAEPDHSFYCKCHGSEFDPEGKVKKGPARRDLPLLHSEIDSQGRLRVTVPNG